MAERLIDVLTGGLADLAKKNRHSLKSSEISWKILGMNSAVFGMPKMAEWCQK